MMAAGKRPVPFRTRKLSPPAPMVLPPGGSGRVGYRRPNNFTHNTRLGNTTFPRRVLLHIRSQSPTAGVWGDPPHCGQPHSHPSLAHTNQILARVRLRIADNKSRPHDWRLPTKVRGATPHCGQPDHHPSLVRAHQFRVPVRLRIADNPRNTNYWRSPRSRGSRRRSAFRTTAPAPTSGAFPRTTWSAVS